MQTALERRNLTDRPQRLGFLPTTWFWNDGERCRLALPIVLWISLPLTPLLFVLVGRYQLSVWLLPIATVVWPYVVMGFVERRIRGELRRRSLRPLSGGMVLNASGSSCSPRPWPSSDASMRRICLVCAVFAGVAAVVAAGSIGGAAVYVFGALALTLMLWGSRMLSVRLRGIESSAGRSQRALREPGEGV